jgi:hypothetical protein
MVFGLRGFWALDYLQVMASPVTGVNPLAPVSTLMTGDDQDQLTAASLAGSEGTIQSESLATYLGRLVCTGCRRCCSLLAPQCQTGAKQAAAATAVYESQTATADEDGVPASEQDGITNNQVVSPSWWNFPGVTGMMVLGTYYLITWKRKT